MSYIALTFDDGPCPGSTETLLQILARHGVKATFFLLGENMLANPHIAAQIVAAGHQVGNHSFSHKNLKWEKRGTIEDEINKTTALIRSAGYQGRIDFRAPYLACFPRPYLVLRKMGMRCVGGSLTAQDWTTQDPDIICDRVVSRAQHGSIIILHDGSRIKQGESSYEDRMGTVQAVDKIIPILKERGYQFLTISRFFDKGLYTLWHGLGKK